MARYLTPAKIGLLVLTELYVEEAVPSDAIVPVLSFIASHAMGYDPNGPSTSQAARWTKAERAVSLVISIKDFEKLLSSYPFLMGLPGKRLWDQFLNKLWGIDSLHALGEFFEHLSWTLSRTKEELRREGLDPDEPSWASNSPTTLPSALSSAEPASNTNACGFTTALSYGRTLYGIDSQHPIIRSGEIRISADTVSIRCCSMESWKTGMLTKLRAWRRWRMATC